MSINSINQNVNWPDGATNLLISGQSTTGTYTYPTTLTAGIYAVKVASLNKDTTGVYVTATANGQTETILNNGTGYLNLTSNETSLVVRPTGAVPTTFTSKYAQVNSLATQGTYSIAEGGGTYVVLGINAASQYALFTSVGNLYNTYSETYNGSTILNASSRINYGGGKFVALSLQGVVVSTDGVTWTSVNLLGTSGSMLFADYANNRWIASANNSSLYTSTDALTWTAIQGNFIGNSQVNQGVYANNKYTVVSNSGTLGSATTNLRQWITADPQFAGNAVNSIYFANSLYVIGGAAAKLSTSTDAVTWTARTSGFGATAINEVTYGNGIWVAVGAAAQMRTSTDAITWTTRTSQFGSSAINGVAYGAGVYVAVGAGGRMTSSTDATTWTAVTTSGFGTSIIHYVTYTNGLFVAVGVGGRISSSTNGTTWTGVTAGTAILQAATYFNGNYIVTGSTGNIWASTDLTTWTQRTSNSTSAQFTLVHNGTNEIFAAGAGGVINPSTDGITWTGSTYGNPINISVVFQNAAYGASKYLVSANTTTFLTSTDAITWTTVASPTSAVNLVYGTAGFVFLDGSSLSYVSTDAITWTSSAGLSWSATARQLSFVNGYYTSATNSPSTSYYWYSTNGTTWTQSSAAGTAAINRLINVGGTYITTDSNPGNAIRVNSSANIGGSWAEYMGASSAVGIAVNGNTLVTAAGTTALQSADGGATWSNLIPSTYTSGTYAGATYGGGYYILTDSSVVHASTNLSTWTSQGLSFIKPTYGTTLTGNIFVAALSSGSTSPLYYNTGTNFSSGWTNAPAVFAVSSTVTGLNFIGNRLFVGATDKISFSDSITSSTYVETAVSGFTPRAFAGYERNYYAFGTSGKSFYSTNGTTWVAFSTGFGDNTIFAATYSNGVFAISGNGTKMAFSTDGITWTLTTTGTPNFVAQTVINNQYYYAGGSSAISVYSGTSSYPMMYSIYGVNPNTI